MCLLRAFVVFSLLLCACSPSAPAVKSEVVTADDDTFEKLVLRSDKPVLLDLTATWCPPCQRLAPILDELSAELAGKVKFVKLDVDEAPKSAEFVGVQVLPTMVLYHKGKEVDRTKGLPSSDTKAVIAAWIEKSFGK